jgi:hypothetical protein
MVALIIPQGTNNKKKLDKGDVRERSLAAKKGSTAMTLQHVRKTSKRLPMQRSMRLGALLIGEENPKFYLADYRSHCMESRELKENRDPLHAPLILNFLFLVHFLIFL